MKKDYIEFLKGKVRLAESTGFDIDISELNPNLKPHNKLMVKWMVEGGRRACFANFGLHKTVTQLEVNRIILTKTGGRGLIIAPLGVRAEFIKDAINILNWETPPKFIRRIEECEETGIYLTNYETVRDGKLDPRLFSVACLDEASILRGLGGSKTFREFMRLFTGDSGPNGDRRGSEVVPYRFVATATPSPNEYIELLAYADFLGVMDVSQAKTRFFKRDSVKADNLKIYPHKEEEFWLWVASWALFVTRPSDLTGNEDDDEGYILPPLDVRWHEIASDHSKAGIERNGQFKAFAETAIGLEGSAKEKRLSLINRVHKMHDLYQEDPEAHIILWHDLEDERRLIEKTFPNCKSVFGSQKLEIREDIVSDFSQGILKQLAGKPSMLGSGTNLQKHCSWAIYSGIGFKFNDFIQSIHRLLRFGQPGVVRIDLIYTESERLIRKQLERKWQQHNLMVNKMIEIVKKFGLSRAAMAQMLTRKMGVERIEVKGENFTYVNNDNVLELPRIASDSVGLILSSIPFEMQYEYSPNYADYGHCESSEEFWEQMDYSTPEAFRTLMPGRICAIHIKDRIVPGGINGLGFQTVSPVHIKCINHYLKHGFHYIGMKTIVTDVVRENSQTYRLGWTEQCKDGSKMGVGMPEYLLYFRKAPTDSSNAYADIPVVKQKREYDKTAGDFTSKGYSRARWQMDAHGFTRSCGDRLLNPKEVAVLESDAIYKLFRTHSLGEVWDFEQIVKIAETVESAGKLPPGFMLLQPQSWSPEVWTDITRMLTLNGSQWSNGKEAHVCVGGDTLVLTKRGYLPIIDVTITDEVLTHTGQWKQVLENRLTRKSAPTIKLSAQGVPNLILTPDHKVWSRKHRGYRPSESFIKNEPQWTEAQELLTHYVNLKLPAVIESNLSNIECELIGRWLADGHIDSRGHQYFISVGDHKLIEFKKSFEGFIGASRPAFSGGCVQIGIVNLRQEVKDILDKCGNHAHQKLLPHELISLNKSLSKSLVDGYIAGDGHLSKDKGSVMVTSVSRSLLLGMAIVIQRAYEVIASVYAGRSERKSVIQGRPVNCKQEWLLSFYPDGKHSFGKILNDGAWKRVSKIETHDNVDVYCLTVEDDGSFTAEGCIVKNCPMQFDIADRVIEQMSNPGDLVLDYFGGLGTVPLRAIKKGRRGYGIELNPVYFLDAVGYLKSEELKQNVPTLFDAIENLKEDNDERLMEAFSVAIKDEEDAA